MKSETKMGLAVTVVGMLIISVFSLLLLADSAEVRSYDWAKNFCGGKDTDISQFSYIIKGHVYCKDGRQTDVPL